MSKKHYEALAAALHEERGAEDEWLACVHAVADVCATFNPRFDRERFLSACHGIPFPSNGRIGDEHLYVRSASRIPS